MLFYRLMDYSGDISRVANYFSFPASILFMDRYNESDIHVDLGRILTAL